MTRRRWIAEHGMRPPQPSWARRPNTWLACCAPTRHGSGRGGGRPRLPRAGSRGNYYSEVRFNLISEIEADPALPVTLVLAIYKFDHMK